MPSLLRRAGSTLAGACTSVLLALTCTGCGSGAQEPGNGPTAVTSTDGATPSASSSPPPGAEHSSRQLPPKPPKGERGKLHTVRGQIAEAVEAGCVVLSTGETSYNLLDAPAKLRSRAVGTEIVVRGKIAETLATTCQQGTPLRVISAHPA